MRLTRGCNVHSVASCSRISGHLESPMQRTTRPSVVHAPERAQRGDPRLKSSGAASSVATRRYAETALSRDQIIKRIPESALESLIKRAPVARAAGLGLDVAKDILRAPDGAIRKEGGASGKQIRRRQPALESPPEDTQHASIDHPALDVVRTRRREGSIPGKRADGFKVGLVVEGGGMRGVVTGAALQAMHDLGMRSAFDAVYGSSAGAINATYFLSGQREGVNIYTEEIANEDFINLKRLFKKDQAPALDLGYLLNVMHHKRPLDWDAVLASDVPLKVVASCLDTLQPVILEDFTSAEDLEICLRASANVPEVAGQPIAHRGRRLVDAAVFEPVPFRAAIADGCTHIVTLCSRPPFMGGRVAKIIDSLVSDAVKRFVMNPEYMRAAWMREMENNMIFGMTTDEMLLRGLDKESHELPHFAGTHVFPVFPGKLTEKISPLCTSVPFLEAGMAEGRAMVARTFPAEAAAYDASPAAAAPFVSAAAPALAA